MPGSNPAERGRRWGLVGGGGVEGVGGKAGEKRLVFHLDSNSTGLWGTIKPREEEVLSFLNALGRAY